MIEVIGIGCRYPGDVNSAQSMWDRMQSKTSAIREVPAGRWKAEDFVGAQHELGKTITSRAGWLEQIDQFDTTYFRLSPKRGGRDRSATTIGPRGGAWRWGQVFKLH